MLPKNWAKLRGNDKWIDVEARVIESCVRDLDMLGGPSSKKTKPMYFAALVRIAWLDISGVTHSGEFEAPEDSPLFQLIEGDSIAIRYNPRAPDEFNVRGLARDQALSVAKKVVFATVVGAVVILVWFGPELPIIFSKK